MTLYDRRKAKLIDELKNKEYRDAFVSEHIDTGIPFQIRALRDQRKWSQEVFARHAKKHQAAVSRLENPDYGGFTLTTLKEIASAFDVALIVRFVPISELVEWELNLSPKSVQAVSFDEDAYFKEKKKEETIALTSAQYATISPTKTSSNVVNIKDYLSKPSKPSSPKNINITAKYA